MLKKEMFLLSLIVLLFSRNIFCESQGFSAVQCGSDIPKALIGQTMPNERVALIEDKFKNLGLKDLGATEISKRLFLISWRICGDEYVLLEEDDVVNDVLKFPPHSKDFPQFVGECQMNGLDLHDTIIAVLKRDKTAENLPATIAWRIDKKKAKFLKLNAEEIRCPTSGVTSADEAP